MDRGTSVRPGGLEKKGGKGYFVFITGYPLPISRVGFYVPEYGV